MRLKSIEELKSEYEALIARHNEPEPSANGIFCRYKYPILTADHAPLIWRYDFSRHDSPCMERVGINAVMNSGAIRLNGKYYLMARVEGIDRKSFFAIAESDCPTEGFRFWDYPVMMPEVPGVIDTNMYDARLTLHEDGYIYAIFCAERQDPAAAPGDLSSALASAAVARTLDLIHWERLDDVRTLTQQRNVVLHPEFVDGKYALYTRPQDGFIDTGNGGGIGFALVDDICHAVIKEETIINERQYHTIKEVKNGEGPHPIKTSRGWLHLAHGVRSCAAGLRYVLYLYVTALDDPRRIIAEPSGYFMAPVGDERIGDVSNVLFSNGWIEDNGRVYIYYASSDTRMHVAESTVDRLLDYCFNTPPDGLRSIESVKAIYSMVDKNLHTADITREIEVTC